MRVGLFQFSPARFDIESNLSLIENSLIGCEAKLIVLPELALTGYLFPSKEQLISCSCQVPGTITDRIEKICRKLNLAMIAGLPEKADGVIYNSAVAIGPEGILAIYRKMHLFMEEKNLFEPGNRFPVIFELDGVKIGILICFDWIFPEAARTLALSGADIIAHLSNLVLPFAQNAAITRCVENRIFWILANRTGEETEGNIKFCFTGKSRIIKPDGKVLIQCHETNQCLAIAEINPEEARNKKITSLNDIFKDRRPEFYRL